jgi:hypothetical protein
LETNQVEFSSLVVWREFITACCHPLRSAARPPRAHQSLSELLGHILKALDCPRMETAGFGLCVSVENGESVAAGALQGRVPQLFATSVDAGGFFASDDFVDSIVQQQGISQRWGSRL